MDRLGEKKHLDEMLSICFFWGMLEFWKSVVLFFLLFNVVLLVLLWVFFGISKIFMNNGKHPTSYNNYLG